jgi:hypothetical protein
LSFKAVNTINDQISNPCEVLPTVYAVSTFVIDKGMGLPIGSIFAYASTDEPAGAFSLNGQTI